MSRWVAGGTALLAVGVLVLGYAQFVAIRDAKLGMIGLPCRLTKPMLALELAGQCGSSHSACLDEWPKVINEWPGVEPNDARAGVATILRLDDWMALAYLLLAVAFGVMAWRSQWRLIGIFVPLFAAAIAYCDWNENEAIRGLLTGQNTCPRYWASWKWGLLFGALCLLLFLYRHDWRSSQSLVVRALAGVAFAVTLIAVMVVFAGMVSGMVLLEEGGVQRTMCALAIAVAYLGARQFFSSGFRNGIDRLAAQGVAKRLAQFPDSDAVSESTPEIDSACPP